METIYDFTLPKGYMDNTGEVHKRGKTSHMHRTIVRYCHITIGRHLEHFTLLRITIDIDDHLIARTQHVVLGGGNVHLGFKRELLVIEDITTKDLLTLLLLLTEIEGVDAISATLIERLFTADLAYLQDMYQRINDIEPPTLTAVCPDCGKTFEVPLNFTGEG